MKNPEASEREHGGEVTQREAVSHKDQPTGPARKEKLLDVVVLAGSVLLTMAWLAFLLWVVVQAF